MQRLPILDSAYWLGDGDGVALHFQSPCTALQYMSTDRIWKIQTMQLYLPFLEAPTIVYTHASDEFLQ
jgi:hypothetical protein